MTNPKKHLNSVPGQATEEAQQSVESGQHYSGGNARLDAENQARQQQYGDRPLTDPATTNMDADRDEVHSEEEGNYTTTGAYPVEADRLGEGDR